MTLPRNIFGGQQGHRRWVVSSFGSNLSGSKYMWSAALDPGPDDWTVESFPDPTGDAYYTMSQIGYDPDRDMFMAVGSVRGIEDPDQGTFYPNWSPYIIRSSTLR